MITFLGTSLAAIAFTEVVGYFLHILLHSEKVPYLSRTHMLHHLRDYGPDRGLRPAGKYQRSSRDRFSVFGVGLEWAGPIAIIVVLALLAMAALGLDATAQLLFVGTAIAWGYLGFGYMHDAMHLQKFWMEKIPLLGRWFTNIRKLHDIHHLELSDDGRMLKNYGICFFGLDRLFGSLSARHKNFNRGGFEAAKKRYAYIYSSRS